MTTDRYDLHTIDYSVQGWDEILLTDMEILDDVIPTRELVTLGESVSAYQPLYQKPADSKWYKAKADGTMQPSQGIAMEGGINNQEIRMHRMGSITNPVWNWTLIGKPIYLDPSTAGALTQVKPPANDQGIGYAMSATKMLVFIQGEGGGGGAGGGHTIEDEGSPLTQRTKLNFVGAGVTATDDAPNDATVVTIPIPPGPHVIEDEGSPLTQRSKLNFVGGGIAASDDPGNDATIVTVPTIPPGPHVIESGDTPVTQRPYLSFEGAGVVVSDDAGEDETVVTIPAVANTVTVRKDSGANIGTKPRLNLIQSTNVSITVVNDDIDNEIDITIALAGL